MSRLAYSPVSSLDARSPLEEESEPAQWRRWPRGRCWLLAAALVLASEVVISKGRKLRPAPHGPFEGKAEIPCGQFRENVDYLTRMALYPVNHVSSAEDCRAKCLESEECGAWTWAKERGVFQASDICFLKRLAQDESPVELPRQGAVSSMACRRPAGKAAAAVAAAPGSAGQGPGRPSCDFLDNTDLVAQEDLRAVPGVSSAEVCRATCRAAPGCGAWTWGKDSCGGGLAYQCFLKRLEPGGADPRTVPKVGVMSGLACVVPLDLSPGLLDGRPKEAEAPMTTRSTLPTTSPAPTTGTDAAASADAASSAALTSEPGPTATADAHAGNTSRAQSLFCFALMVPFGYEAGLLGMQYHKGTSLFACDEYAVYSNTSMAVGLGFKISVVNISLQCERGGEFQSLLNLEVFRAVWARVVGDGQFEAHEWTVKVDADTVFFPQRLRQVLQEHHAGPGVYLNNCKFGMHGPLEVLSRAAVQALGEGWDRCDAHFREVCLGPCWWGEDLFVDQCLSEVLGVRREYEGRLLSDDHCEPPQDWASCKDRSKVAFHPFKTADSYRRCLESDDLHSETVVLK